MFVVGDRVIAIRDHPDGNGRITIGSTGTVCDLSHRLGHIGVRWDDKVGGHDCRGSCDRPHGWYVSIYDIQLDFGEDFSVADAAEISDLLS